MDSTGRLDLITSDNRLAKVLFEAITVLSHLHQDIVEFEPIFRSS
jgi:hypothetical protein